MTDRTDRTDRTDPDRNATTPSRDSVRIAGFPIQANPTVFLLFGLIAYLVASGLLPAAAPGATSGAYWAGGLVAAALFMGSLLAHELAHAVVARRHGIRVEAVTFWLFGGMAKLGGDAQNPRAEWRIAAIGPVVNLALGAAIFGIGRGMSALSAPELAVAVAGYVAGINLLLGAFNLLPAVPLDGGRVLRALLWRRSGDRDRATVIAANAGQGIAALIVVAGIVELTAVSAIGGLWTTLIGGFLFGTARAEARRTSANSALAGLRVRDLLPPQTGEVLPAVPAWHTVAGALEAYQRTGDRRIVLPLQGFDGSPAGLVALAQLAAVPVDQRETVRVAAVAAPLEHVAVTHPDELVVELLPRLVPATRNLAAARLAGHALVVAGGVAVGVLTPSDIARAMQVAKLLGPRPPIPGSPRDSRPDDDGPPSWPTPPGDSMNDARRHLVS